MHKLYFKKTPVFVLLLIFIVGCSSTTMKAQTFENVKEFFTIYPNKRAVERDSTIYKQKFILAPVVSFSPETNFSFGTGAKYLFKFNGSREETRVSNMPITLQYSLNSQFFLFSGFEIFTNQEEWVIEGNLIFQNFPRLYYGMGTNTPDSAEEQYDNTQFLFEPIFLKQLFHRYLFIGGGFRYNRIYDTGFEPDGIIAQNQPDGFNGSTSVGAEAAALFDNRSNILNAQDGWFVNFTVGVYGEVLGGTNVFNLTRFDARHFLSVSPKNNDVLAFQFVGQFTRGNIPFSEFSFLGGSDIMRGYREGRYVDRDLLAAQVEYRKNFENSRWGLVGFLGAGDVYRNVTDFQFQNLKPSYGAGARFSIDEEERLNLRLDFGFGENTSGIYFSVAEAF